MVKPKALLTWEAGANFGHAAKIAEIVREIGGAVDVTVVVRDPVMFRAVAPDLPVRMLQSPVPPYLPDEPTGWNFADNLRQLGYVSGPAVAALMEGWRGLYDLVQPDILIAESSPTALLAARGLGIKTMNVGTGFDIPPDTAPMPIFFHWSGEHRDRAVRGEVAVLAHVNDALARFGRTPVPSISAMLEVDATALTTIPELDHYPTMMRDEVRQPYVGALYSEGTGAEVAWHREGQRVFAYLRNGLPGVDAMIAALGKLSGRADVILASPGLPHESAVRLSAAGVRCVDGPVKLKGLLETCDLGINHASFGTSAAFMMAGVPQIGLPSQIEQMMLSQAIAKTGAGVALNGKASVDEMRGIVLKALDATSMRDVALAVRDKYREDCPAKIAGAIAARAMALLQ